MQCHWLAHARPRPSSLAEGAERVPSQTISAKVNRRNCDESVSLSVRVYGKDSQKANPEEDCGTRWDHQLHVENVIDGEDQAIPKWNSNENEVDDRKQK